MPLSLKVRSRFCGGFHTIAYLVTRYGARRPVRGTPGAVDFRHAHSSLSLAPYPSAMVRRLAFRPRMVCTGCGMAGADARPNWQERRKVGAVWR